jgi:ABC-2 type transport system permease protein
MKRAFIVALNEIRLYVQDKGDLLFSLFLPIIVFALMYFGFSGDTIFHGTASIVNEDTGGTYATELVRKLEQLDNVDIKVYTMDQAEERLDSSDLLMFLYIPKGFSDNLSAGKPARLIFRQRGNGGQEGQIVASLIDGIVGDINREIQVYSRVTEALEGTDASQSGIDTVIQQHLTQETEHPIVKVTETTVGSSPNLVNQFLPGVVNMFVLFAITISARAIVEERKKGTLERLLTTRLSVGQLFFGKFLASLSRGLIQTIILLVLAYAVFQIFTPLSFLECIVIAILFAGAAGALGLVIATIARSEDAATWIAVFFTMAMVMLGGSFFDIPEGSALYTISRFSIITYANEAFRTIIAEGGSISELGMQMGIMAGVMVVGLAISRFLFKIIPGGR